MNATHGQAGTPRARRRWPWLLLAACMAPVALLVLLWLVVLVVLPPERMVPLVLARIGATLNLEISAQGDPASRLSASPTFVVRNVVAREPGAERPLLQARRILVALPWSTLRSLGDTLDLARIEIDAPTLDVPALQHWLATRPPGDGRLPTLSDGLQVRAARIEGTDWRIEALDLSIPRLQPLQPLRARANGRYADAAMQAPFVLAATLMRPASGHGVGLAGTVVPARGGWRVPAWVTLSGALHWSDTLQLLPARFGASGRFESGDARLPFSLGLHGPLRTHSGAWTLLPAGISLRGNGLVPTLDATGHAVLGKRLALALDGRIAQWPQAWPTLPPPLGDSREPLALSLRYHGAPGLDDPLELHVARDDLRFDGRLDVPALATWAGAVQRDSPLPPLSGRLGTPALEISGARLEGVVVEFGEGDGSDGNGAQAPATP